MAGSEPSRPTPCHPSHGGVRIPSPHAVPLIQCPCHTAGHATTERLLRQLSAHEMDRFCDFLPWIWGDLRVQFTAKLVNHLPVAERKHLAMQIGRDKDMLETQKESDEIATYEAGLPDVTTIPVAQLDEWNRRVNR